MGSNNNFELLKVLHKQTGRDFILCKKALKEANEDPILAKKLLMDEKYCIKYYLEIGAEV